MPADDLELGKFLVTDWTDGIPSPCLVPTASSASLGCFAALGMSGAVPGTEQSGNEMQGTDFGGGMVGDVGTQTLLKNYFQPPFARQFPQTAPRCDPDPRPVYSHCARLVIQKIAGEPTWDQTSGQYGVGVGAPLVNVANYAGTWSTEITSSGSIVYGYNWNAKTASTGTYRLTMVLDGNDTEGPACSTTLATSVRRMAPS